MQSIELTGLRCMGLRNRRFYCTIEAGEDIFETPLSTKTREPSWDSAFLVPSDGVSPITVHVWMQQEAIAGLISRRDILVGDITIDQPDSGPRGIDSESLLMKDRDKRQADACISFTVTRPVGASQKYSLATSPTASPGLSSSSAPRLYDPFAEKSELSNHVAAATVVTDAMRPAWGPAEIVVSAVEGAENIVSSISDACDSWDFLLGKLQIFVEITDGISQIHPYAQLAFSVIAAIPKAIVSQTQKDDALRDLVDTMSGALNLMQEAEPLRQDGNRRDTAQLIARQVRECAHFISKYARTERFAKRLIQNLGRNIADDVAKYKESFAKLIQRFNDHTVVVTNIVTLRVMESVGRFDQSLTLSSLLVAPGSGFQPEKGCLPGTRTPLIDLIMKWVYSVDEEDTKPVFWLHGPAGSGKSAISHAVAERCRADGRLGRIFCFSTSARDRKLEQMFPTIAVGLADLDPDWRKTLCETIQRDHEHDLNTTYSLQLQFENFLLEPAKGLEERAVGPIVVIIDALDECGGISQRAQLLKYISRFAELPSNFRFLFTSRSDRDMMDVLSKLPCVRSQDIADPEYDTADADIGLFVNESLSTYSMITEDPRWVSSRVVDTLVGAAEKSFQWASTACAFIRGEGDYQEYDWHERFEAVVGSVSASQQSDVQYHNLDSLYHLVLSRLFKSGPSIRFKRILGRVLAVREPLSIEALKGLHGEDEGPEWTKNLLSLMGSLLYGVSQAETPIRPLHGSFREFLTDGTRSGPYCVDLDDADDKLVHSTLRIMKSSLRFNICHLESSYKLNTEYDDLDQRIRTYMTPGLIYSIRYWAQHVGQERAASDPNLLWNIENFFANHALSWLESLSLLRSLLSCASTLSALKRFASANAKASRLLRWVDDMDRFIHLYGAVISSSAPHIYVSALPFSPTTSLIAQYYAERFSQSAKVFRGRATHWPALRSVMRGHSELVVSVAFSRDGKRIVSASYDHLIRVWDAATGEAVGKPLEGHTADVNSVMFSFDGRRILSCSDDETIRLWDAESGEALGGPLTGHGRKVNSVAFSPDDNYIVSGGNDGTIRVWDAMTGEAIGQPMEDGNAVNAVAFSPDGARLVAGSEDNTVNVWDIASGELLFDPFVGHSGPIRSVAFFPDGKRIASASDDCTVRVWDAGTGQTIQGPFRGHTDAVFSVSVSSDGKRIVSGSLDDTIRIWDADSEDLIGQPIRCRSTAVASVAFSPDGTYIVSGSADKTVRVWYADSGESVRESIEGHSGGVSSIDFSPDGVRLISGSYDQSIRLWNVGTGKAIAKLTWDDQNITAVAFSPDGKRIASGSFDKMIRIWDTEQRIAIRGPLRAHSDIVRSVAFAPDGVHVISGSDDGTIGIWSAETGTILLLRGHRGPVLCVAVSADGEYIISGSTDRTIRVWSLKTRQAVGMPLRGHLDRVTSVAFSPDGTLVASGSDDTTVRLWNAETGEPIGDPLEGHLGSVNALAFSPDGRCIISGSDDGSIRIWDLERGKLMGIPLRGHVGVVRSVRWSPDGSCIASGSLDCSIRIWDTEEATEPSKGAAPGVAICFSSMQEHRLSNAHLLFSGSSRGLTELQMKRAFYLDMDGWIRGPHQERLLWVPDGNRSNLWQPSSRLLLPEESTTMLDLCRFAHGNSWPECYTPRSR